MTFYEDGNILFDVIEGSYYTGYPYESWVGKYELILAEDQLYPPGTIVFDMELNWWVYEWDEENDRSNQQYTPRIKGTYRFDAYAGGTLDLFLNDGDDLYPYREENPEFYTFWFGDYVGWTDSFSNMTDEELVGWLISQVPEAYEWICTYGMTPLITGDYTQFTDGDVGRDIWLGTDSGGKFTREILYSIGLYGAIYEYDAVGDRWTLLYTVDMANEGTTHTLLAHVRFGEYLVEGVAQLLVDEVTWIDDPWAPNGYRIANDVEDWVPYIITEQTSIDLWRYDPAEGMVLSTEGLNEFIFELEEGWREGVMLAHVAVAEEIIQAILEQYVP